MPTVFIYWSPGRTREQKAAVIEEVTNTLVEHGGANREDTLIIFQEIQAGDFGRGGIIPASAQQDTLNGDFQSPV